MKNNDFTNKQIIIALIVMIVVGFAALFWVYQLSYTPNKEPDSVLNNLTDEQIENVLVNDGYSDDTIQNMTDEEKDQAALSNNDLKYESSANKQYSTAVNAQEYPNEDSIKKYTELLAFFETYNYNYAASQVQDVLVRFNLTNETNLKLANLMSDAIIMQNYEDLDWERKEQSLKMFKNPETFVIGVLRAYPRRREAVILDVNGYTPVSDGVLHIIGSTKIDEQSVEYKAMSGYLEDTRNIYRVDFSFGEFESLYAYVAETHDRVLRIVGFYSDYEYEYLRTVTWWMELGVDREKGA